MTEAAAFRPLAGLRVVDLGQGVAGPYCGQLLGDHGAEVVKVEPPRGDWARTMGTSGVDGQGGVFVSVNRNKRGICLDLRHAEAVSLLRQLISRADVVVDSFRPGVMERLGLGAKVLRAQNPGLVYCAITGFGPTGPNAELPAGDSTMQAYGGLMSIVGERDGEALRVGNVVSDMLAGTNAFSGVLLALLSRAADARGRDVHVSLLDSIVAFQAPPLTEFLMTGKVPERLGNSHPLIAPSGAARASDGAFIFTVFDHQWVRFCEGLGRTALATDPRFATSGARQVHRDALSAELAPLFASREKAQWIEALRAMDVLCAPINSYPELIGDAQVRHNGLIASTSDAGGQDYPMLRNPVRLQDSQTAMAAPPRLGEHTRELLGELCGCPAPLIDDLLARGVALAMHKETEHA